MDDKLKELIAIDAATTANYFTSPDLPAGQRLE